MSAKEITEGPVVELTKKINEICEKYRVEEVRDAMLNILTFYVGDLAINYNIHANDLIDSICESLKDSTKQYIMKNSN